MNNNENRAKPVSDRTPSLLPWVIWGVGALFFSYGFFHRVTASVMVSDIMRDFGVSGAILGNLSAFYFYAYAGLQVPVGVAVDRFGPRRVMTLAALLCAAGSLMFGLAPDITVAYMGRLLIGAGAGFALIGTFKLGTIWFPPERFALVTGLTATIGVLGAAVGQAPLGAAIAHYGWRTTMVAAAIFGVGVAALIWTIARDRSPYRPAPEQPASTMAGVLGGVGSVFGTVHNWAFALILASMTVPLLAFAGLWGVPFLMEAYDLSRPAAAGTTSLFLIGHGVGSASFGWTSDRIRRRKPPVIVGTIVTTAVMAFVIYVPGLPYIAVQGLLFVGGIASGASVINFAFAREHNRAAVAATAMGLVNLLNMGCSAIFQPLLGWFLDLTWDGTLIDGARIYSVESFRTAFTAVIAIGIAGIVASLFVRETHCTPLDETPLLLKDPKPA
jgi:MFS family permease